MGHADDIVVDNYSAPSRIIGIADGIGDFKRNLEKEDIIAINNVKNMFELL